MPYKDKDIAREYNNKHHREDRKKNGKRIRNVEKKSCIKNKEKIRERRRIYRQEHPEIMRERDKRNQEKHREKRKISSRNRNLVVNYNITLDEYNLLLKEQDYKCALCGTEKAGGRGTFHVDHDHKTGKVRGLLCHHCNTGLGLFYDSENLLLKAILYLKN